MTTEEKKPNRHIDVYAIAQPPVHYIIWAEDQNHQAGYCLVTIDIIEPAIIGAPPIKEATLWHIYIDPKFRRRGYAGDLIRALQLHFNSIVTSALSDESMYMLKKHGFEKDGRFFRWRRPQVFDGKK